MRSAPPLPSIWSGPSVPVSASAALEPLTVFAMAVAAGARAATSAVARMAASREDMLW